jgi:hypothetical protein
MHTQYPKIKEDNEFPKVLLAKQNLETPGNMNNQEFYSVATILSGLKSGQGVLPSGLKILPYHLDDIHNLTPKIREDTVLQR